MNKHTPGPWAPEGFEQVVGNGAFYGGLIVGDDGETVVAQCVMAHNARLIAAAPELLEALKLALSAHGVMLLSDPPQEAWKTYGVEQKARAAIARAEGEKT